MRRSIVVFMVAVLGLFAMAGSSHAVDAELLWSDLYPDYNFEPDKISARSESVVTDSVGNVYSAGTLPVGYYDSKYYISKHDPNGNLLWQQTYDIGYINEWNINQVALRVDGQDNVYLAGEYRDETKTTQSSYTAVVLKYSPDGGLLWEYIADLPDNLLVYRFMNLEIDDTGNAYLLNLTEPYPQGYRIDKIDPDGNLLWTDHRAGASSFNHDYTPVSMVLDVGGSVHIAMRTGRVVSYDPSGNPSKVGPLMPYPSNYIRTFDIDQSGSIYAVFSPAYTVNDPIVAKFDSAGTLLWQTGVLFSGPSEPRIKVAPDGTLVIVNGGAYGGNGDISSGESVIVSKYDPSGNLLWSNEITVGAYRDVGGVQVDTDGNIYVTGAADMGGNIDAYAVKFDHSGALLWDAASNVSGYHDYPMAIAVDASGNLLAAGLAELFYVKPGWPFYFRGKYFVTKFGPSNSPPVADAGADLSVECGNTVTLDGSGSTDPDGDALTYTWNGPFGSVGGVTATVTLPLGTHTVTLTVDDGNGGTSPDDVVITVKDTTPPVITAGLSGTELQQGLYLSAVLFEMSASDSCSGVTNVSYTLDGLQTIVTGSYASDTISTGGEHTILFDSTDNSGNTSSAGDLSFTLFEANAEGLTSLIDYFVGQGLISPQMQNNLTKQAAHGSYQAFINHVEAQSGKKIDPAAAQILIQAALYLMGQ